MARRAPRPLVASSLRPEPFLLGLRAITVIVILLLLLPLAIILGASFTAGAFMTFPPQGLSLDWYRKLFEKSDWLSAIEVSLAIAACAAILATTIGVSLGVALSRFRVLWPNFFKVLAVLPLLFPPVVMGVAFLTFYTHLGVHGLGFVKLTLSDAIFNEPFPFLLIFAALAKLNPEIEQAAMSLGATVPRLMRTITLPMLAKEIFAGFILTFVLTLNDFTIAFLVSDFTITTLPIKIFTSLRYSYSPLIAVASALFIVVTFVGVAILSRLTRGVFE